MKRAVILFAAMFAGFSGWAQAEKEIHLEEVVVTAEKRLDTLQLLPLSVSALSSKKIREYRIWNARDLTAIVPTLYSSNPGDNRNVTSIRGITSTSYDPAVATYIDGVNQFGLDTYIAQLFDVERIEVLRGPQGTLYGRNAMGGVINIITKPPVNKTEGFEEVSLGTFGQQRYSAGVRVPLVKEKLFLGVAGIYESLAGFYTNQFNDTKFDRKHSFTGNYFLKYFANQAWMLTLNVKHNANRNHGPFTLASGFVEALEHPFQLNQNATTTMVDNVFNASLAASYNGKAFNFVSQSSYQSNYRFYRSPIDGDFSPIDGVTIINNYGHKWNNVKVFTQEFRFSSPETSASKLRYTSGVYFFHQDSPNKQATRFGADARYVGVSGDSLFSIINTTTAKTTGGAVFGQLNWKIAGPLEFIAGLRYDYERKQQHVLGEYQHDPNPDPIFETRPDTSAVVSFNALSPKAGLIYRFSNQHNLYTMYSRGYRTGGFTQLSSDPSQPPLYSYKPEYSNNMEVGSKNTFLDNRLRVNASVFYVTVTDAQVPTLVLPQAITVTRNAGKLTSTGAELEISANFGKRFQLDYSGGLTKATFKTLQLSQYGTAVDLAGKRQLFTPSTTSMTALQYRFPLAEESGLVVRGEWMYLGPVYFDLANQVKQTSYSLVNARVGWATKGLEIMFWARNLTNKKYVEYAYDFGAAHLGNPRNYGITIRTGF